MAFGLAIIAILTHYFIPITLLPQQVRTVLYWNKSIKIVFNILRLYPVFLTFPFCVPYILTE